MRIQNRFCDGNYQLFTSSSVILKIKNNISDFSIGEKKRDEKTEWLEIPLSLVPEGTDEWSFLSLKDEVAISMDERIMKKAALKGPRDFLSKNLYLPPVKYGKPKTYDCSIIFKDCGNQKKDTIAYDFSIYKSKNYMGSANVSEWCVEETN